MGAVLMIPDVQSVGSKRLPRQSASTVPCGMPFENELKETKSAPFEVYLVVQM